jgi:phosphatidylserine/phosphatidylglycerophosphate/cardiolipin synthase-like enzyme
VRTSIMGLVAFLLVAPMSGCAARTVHAVVQVPLAVHADTVPGPGVSSISTLVEPNDGVRLLVRAIDKAQDRIFVETYILSDSRVIRALERAAAQGVDVYVMLEPHPLGMGTQPVRIAEALRASGVAVRWTMPGFALTHAKFAVLDDRLTIVSTANFSKSAFQSNREFLVFDRQASEVRILSNLFRRDWDRAEGALAAPNLVVSPDNSRVKLEELIAQARRSILVYAEEIADPATERELVAAARRGVRVELILAWGATPQAAAELARGGVQVRELRAPYIHAKLMCVDGREAFVGSENISTESLDRNREVGILIRGASLRRLMAIFQGDWRRATKLTP